MNSVYREVWVTVYFLTPEEGGRSKPVELQDPKILYRPNADFGFGYKDGAKILCPAEVKLEGPRVIELGVEQKVRVGFQCPEHSIRPSAEFSLMEGPGKVVATGRIISVIQ